MLLLYGSNTGTMQDMEYQKFEFEVEADSTETQINPTNFESGEPRELKVRLDKWLWAARFFKTRALARGAIEQGKVMYDGKKVAPTTEIELGVIIKLTIGHTHKTVMIKKLSTRRRNSEEACELYQEVGTRRQSKYLRSGNMHRNSGKHQDPQHYNY